MTNLQKGQAEWNNLFQVQGAEVQVFEGIEGLWARAAKYRSGSVVQLDQQEVYGEVDLAGQAIIGTNTDSNGYLYVTFAIAPGLFTQVYKDSGKTALVASGATVSGVATTLNEKNSSGLIDAVATLNAGPPAGFAADSDIRLDVVQGYRPLLENAYQNPGDKAQDLSETKSKNNLEDVVAAQLASLYSQRQTAHDADVALGFIADFLGLTETDQEAGAGFDYTYDTTSTPGQVLISDRQGVHAEARQAMLDESVPGAQSVQGNTITVGNLVARATNQGKLKGEGSAASGSGVMSLSPDQHAMDGTLHLRCTSDTPGETRLSLENVLSEELAQPMEGQDLTTAVSAAQENTVTFRMQDGPTGVDLTPDYLAPVESGDDGDILSGCTLESLNASDTNFGKIFVTVKRTKTTAIDGSDEFTMTIYSDSARTLLRGTEIFTAIVGIDAFSKTLSSGAVFAGTFHQANANTKLPNKNDEDNNIEFDKQIPRVGDRWTIPLTVVWGSRFNRDVAQRYGGSFPGSASPTIAEAFARYRPTLKP